MRVVIAAAGTGGHINPGIAIANKIKEEEPSSEILFIGTDHGLEKDLVPRAGYKLKTIDSHGIARKLTIKNIKRLFKTIGSINEARKILQEFNPDIVVGTGGYICISVCKAAQKLSIPYIIHESNVLPGVATKLLAKKANKILVGFKEAKEKLPAKAKVVYTGTPTKVQNLHLSEEEKLKQKAEMGFSKTKPLVLVFGGSQGAKSINEALEAIIKNEMNENYQIMWAVGPELFDIVKMDLESEKIDIENLKNIKAVPYIYNMTEVLNICDIAVCRSGAMTVTELEKLAKPAIFIPFPYAAENHQEFNARALEKQNAARVILDKDLTAEKLNAEIEDMISDKDNLKQMSINCGKQSMEDVEDAIYREIKVHE